MNPTEPERVCEFYRSRWPIGGRWHARVRCLENGKIVSSLTEGYHNRLDCQESARLYLQYDRIAYV